MSILAAIASELQGNAGVSAIVGTQVALAKGDAQYSVPYVVIQRIGGERRVRHLAASTDVTEIPTLQVDCYETTVALVEALKDAVIAAIQRFAPGTIGNVPNTATIQSLTYSGSGDEFISQQDKNPDGTMRRNLEFNVWYV